jgi:hypothetical protein
MSLLLLDKVRGPMFGKNSDPRTPIKPSDHPAAPPLILKKEKKENGQMSFGHCIAPIALKHTVCHICGSKKTLLEVPCGSHYHLLCSVCTDLVQRELKLPPEAAPRRYTGYQDGYSDPYNEATE